MLPGLRPPYPRRGARAVAPGSGGRRRGRAQVLARKAVARSSEAQGTLPGGGATGSAAAPCRRGFPKPATRLQGGGGRWARFVHIHLAAGG